MTKLIAELRRLYFLDGQRRVSRAPAGDGVSALTPEGMAAFLDAGKTVDLDLVGSDGKVRTLVMEFARSDWAQLEKLFLAVQNDLDLPAPAVSVSGRTGYGLWFSLSEAVFAAQAQVFLQALRREYLAEVPGANLHLCPEAGFPATIELPPAQNSATGKWSAFIDPSLGGLFIDEPWLEMAPSLDKQADILASLESIGAADFCRALDRLQPVAESDDDPGLSAQASAENPPGDAVGARSGLLSVGSHFSDPESFLLAVMNDPSASAHQRIKAAKALLPYFRSRSG